MEVVANFIRISRFYRRYDENISAYFYWDMEFSENMTFKFYKVV